MKFIKDNIHIIMIVVAIIAVYAAVKASSASSKLSGIDMEKVKAAYSSTTTTE